MIRAVEAGDKLSESATAFWARGIAAGLVHLHSRGVAHLDVKLENVFLEGPADDDPLTSAERFTPRLGDFGFATMGTMGITTRFEGPFVAPEASRSDPLPYDPFRADMWSLGVCIVAMRTGHTVRINRAGRVVFGSGVAWDSFSTDLQTLLRGLLCSDPASRLTAAEAVDHPWMVRGCSDGVDGVALTSSSSSSSSSSAVPTGASTSGGAEPVTRDDSATEAPTQPTRGRNPALTAPQDDDDDDQDDVIAQTPLVGPARPRKSDATIAPSASAASSHGSSSLLADASPDVIPAMRQASHSSPSAEVWGGASSSVIAAPAPAPPSFGSLAAAAASRTGGAGRSVFGSSSCLPALPAASKPTELPRNRLLHRAAAHSASPSRQPILAASVSAPAAQGRQFAVPCTPQHRPCFAPVDSPAMPALPSRASVPRFILSSVSAPPASGQAANRATARGPARREGGGDDDDDDDDVNADDGAGDTAGAAPAIAEASSSSSQQAARDAASAPRSVSPSAGQHGTPSFAGPSTPSGLMDGVSVNSRGRVVNITPLWSAAAPPAAGAVPRWHALPMATVSQAAGSPWKVPPGGPARSITATASLAALRQDVTSRAAAAAAVPQLQSVRRGASCAQEVTAEAARGRPGRGDSSSDSDDADGRPVILQT